MRGVAGRIGGAVERLARAITPPPEWRVPVLLAFAVLIGFGGVIFHVSRATSYLSDDPTTCVNCHVMAPQYFTWSHSRHREEATCNDCHVPHDNVFRHYAFKAADGMRHATIFTLRREPQVIRIHPPGQRVVQENCVRCHVGSVHAVSIAEVRGDDLRREQGLRCWDCHRETPHGAVNSLAAVPYEHVPLPGPVEPEWLRALRADPQARNPRSPPP